MNEFPLLSYRLTVNCPTSMSDGEGERIWQAIEDEVQILYGTLEDSLKRKFPEISSMELKR